jgi:predicted nucleic acid-binding Zn ribbon protein
MVELLERWPAAVGEAIAKQAWPARIARDGTVHVHTADAVWAFELGHRAAEIAERLDVPKIRFAPGPLPEPDPEEAPAAVETTPEDEERARAMTSRIRDENLRKSAQRAVALGLARAARDRRV